MFTQIKNTNLGFASLIVFAVTFFVGSFFITNQVQAASNDIIQTQVTTTKSVVYSYPSQERILKGVICPNGMTWETNCTSHFSALGSICPNGMTWETNCTSHFYAKGAVCPNGMTWGTNCGVDLKSSYTTNNKTKVPIKTIPKVVYSSIEPDSVTASITSNPSREETILTDNNLMEINNNESGADIPGREKIGNSLSASLAKIGSIFKGPMSIWIIILILIIIIGGGYGLYSMDILNKDKLKPMVKANKLKENPIVKAPTTVESPVIEKSGVNPQINNASVTNNNQQQGPINTTPEVKQQEIPLNQQSGF